MTECQMQGPETERKTKRELSKWDSVVWGLRIRWLISPSETSWDIEKFSTGPQCPPGNKGGKSKRGPRYQEAWGEGDKVHSCGFFKGVLRQAMAEVLGETLGLQS